MNCRGGRPAYSVKQALHGRGMKKPFNYCQFFTNKNDSS